MRGVKGTRMPRGDKNQIMRFHISTFNPEQMKNIGNFIFSIDHKIELNKAINHNLPILDHSSKLEEFHHVTL